jgi:hypothetical protein
MNTISEANCLRNEEKCQETGDRLLTTSSAKSRTASTPDKTKGSFIGCVIDSKESMKPLPVLLVSLAPKRSP